MPITIPGNWECRRLPAGMLIAIRPESLIGIAPEYALEGAMNQAETRAGHIASALKAAGWGLVEGSRIAREYPITLGRLESPAPAGASLS